jgi:hypothetical protein
MLLGRHQGFSAVYALFCVQQLAACFEGVCLLARLSQPRMARSDSFSEPMVANTADGS